MLKSTELNSNVIHYPMPDYLMHTTNFKCLMSSKYYSISSLEFEFSSCSPAVFAWQKSATIIYLIMAHTKLIYISIS